jgi:hypothetical protein
MFYQFFAAVVARKQYDCSNADEDGVADVFHCNIFTYN